MKIDMLDYYKLTKNLNVDIIYSGPVWSDGIEGIGQTLRKRLAYDELPLSSSQSVFSVFVEQVSNMLMYSEEKEIEKEAEESAVQESYDMPQGIFVLGAKGKTYFVQTGNVIKKENVEFIKDRIDYLNTLDKAELRSFYKEQIKKENTNLESKGAGLGLIEIARRASSKIEYSFVPLDKDSSFFSMHVSIG